MSRAALAVVAALAAGCAHPKAAHGWTVTGEVAPEWAAGALAVAACVQQATHVEPWGGTVVVHPGPFKCSTGPFQPFPILCAGWNPGPEWVEVMFTADPVAGALAHEFGHAALCRPPTWDCTERSADAVSTAARECMARRAVPARAAAVPVAGEAWPEP